MAGIDIRLPSITGSSDKERIEQLRLYLIYLVEQLQYILGNLDETNLTEGFSRRVSDGSGSESLFKQLAEEFSQVVRKNNVISSINQTAETIEILASRLNLNGYTSINGGFNVDENGNAMLTGGSDISLVSEGDNVAKIKVTNADNTRTVTISPATIVVENAEGGAIILNHLIPNEPMISVSGKSGRAVLGGLYGITATAPLDIKTENAANVYMDEYGQLQTVKSLSEEDEISTYAARGGALTELYDVNVRMFESDRGAKFGILSKDIKDIYPAAADPSGTANPMVLVPALLALIQEQNNRITALENA